MRNIHYNNDSYREKYVKHLKAQYDQLIQLLNSYSLILFDIEMRFSACQEPIDNLSETPNLREQQ